MTDAVLIEVAKAVAAELQAGSDAGSFAQRFDVERSYADWDIGLDELDTLKCDVVPVGPEGYAVELATRGSLRYLPKVDIGFRKRFTADQLGSDGRVLLNQIDELLFLFQQLERFWEPCQPSNTGRRLASVTDAVWDKTEILAAYIPHHLRELQQYTGILRITFRLTRAL